GLTPDATASGGGPNAPRAAAYTAAAGGASIACTATPGSVGHSTSAYAMGPARWRRPMAAPLPLRSPDGATTTTSWPVPASALARASRPAASTPSSLVTSTRIARTLPATTATGSGGDLVEHERPVVETGARRTGHLGLVVGSTKGEERGRVAARGEGGA